MFTLITLAGLGAYMLPASEPEEERHKQMKLGIFILFGVLLLFGLAWSSADLSFSVWWAHMEQYNMSHFATGCVFGLIFWIAGFWVQKKIGVKAALFSFLMTALVSVGIEWKQYLAGDASDGFDLVDLLWAGVGWGFGQLYHLATHRWD